MTQKRGRALEFRVTGWTGFKDTASAIISKKWFARRVARKLVGKGGMWENVDLEANDVVIHFPFGAFRVVDKKGSVETFTGQLANIGI